MVTMGTPCLIWQPAVRRDITEGLHTDSCALGTVRRKKKIEVKGAIQ